MIQIYLSPFFPNENFGGDYKNSLVYKLYKKNDEKAFTDEIKSAKICKFKPENKMYTSIYVANKPEELWKLAYYIFDFIAMDSDNKLFAQCNHTFVFRLYKDEYVHVCFSTDDILKEKEFNLYT
jgi:hypothetical protein